MFYFHFTAQASDPGFVQSFLARILQDLIRFKQTAPINTKLIYAEFIFSMFLIFKMSLNKFHSNSNFCKVIYEKLSSWAIVLEKQNVSTAQASVIQTGVTFSLPLI